MNMPCVFFFVGDVVISITLPIFVALNRVKKTAQSFLLQFPMIYANAGVLVQ